MTTHGCTIGFLSFPFFGESTQCLGSNFPMRIFRTKRRRCEKNEAIKLPITMGARLVSNGKFSFAATRPLSSRFFYCFIGKSRTHERIFSHFRINWSKLARERDDHPSLTMCVCVWIRFNGTLKEWIHFLLLLCSFSTLLNRHYA